MSMTFLLLSSFGGLAAQTPASTPADSRARISERIAASDSARSYTLERRRLTRGIDSTWKLAEDPLAAALQAGTTREAVLAREHLANWAELARGALANPEKAKGWERIDDRLEVVHSPHATLQSSSRAGHAHHELVRDELTITASWQNRQVDVFDGPTPRMRYSPSYVYAPLNVGAGPAKWFADQAWQPMDDGAESALLLEFADHAPACEWIRFDRDSARVLQVIVFYGPGDVVANFLEYADEPEGRALPERSLRIECNQASFEIMELRVTVHGGTPSDAAFLLPVPWQGGIVDHRGGRLERRPYGVPGSSWPSEVRQFVAIQSSADPAPAKR